MALYRPVALARLTATLQPSRRRVDALEEVSFLAPVRKVTIARNSWTMADTCSLELDDSRFPVLPRNVRQVLVEVYAGDARGLGRDDTEAIASLKHLQFIGYVDQPEVELSESGNVVKLNARDYTALLIDAKHASATLVPSYQENLHHALRRILDALPGGSNIKLRLEIDGERTREWPDIAEAVPSGKLLATKVPVPSSDASLWDYVRAACDPLSLIPRIELDTLVVSTPRGLHTAPRRAALVYGFNLTSYQERRQLRLIRTGIGLTGYSLETKQFIRAQYPPAGDPTVAKSAKGTKVATSKNGSKAKNATKAATATQAATGINPEDKRDWFPYGHVASQAALDEAAKRLFERRSRLEFEGVMHLGAMRTPAVDIDGRVVETDDDIRTGRLTFDLLSLRAGDHVQLDVLPQERKVLSQMREDQSVEYLVSHGYDRSVASLLVRAAADGSRDAIFVYVRSASISISADAGFEMTIEFMNLLEGETARDVEDDR